MLYYKSLKGLIVMNIIYNSKEVDELPNGTITLYEDMNENLSIILKDNHIDKVKSIELFHFLKENNEIITIILNGQKIYHATLGRYKEDIMIIKKLKKMRKVNVIVWAKDKSIFPVVLVKYKKIKEKDLKIIMDTINS